MSEKWWEDYKWVRLNAGGVLHAVLPDVPHYSACGLHSWKWNLSAADLPPCKTCERSIAATAKRYEGEQHGTANDDEI